MRLNVLFGGKQGQGVNVASSICAEVVSDLGYYVFKYRDYGSLIHGGHAFDVVSFSDEPVRSHESKLDLVLAMNEDTAERHKEDLKDGGALFRAWEHVDESELGRAYNMTLVGSVAGMFGIDMDSVKEKIRDEFSDHNKKIVQKDIEAAEKGYEAADRIRELEKLNRNLEVSSGSQKTAEGAVDSGLDVYLAYPMTPATPVLHELAGMQDEDMMTFQPENELAAINAALGSAHTGAKTMVGTSGGGYDLMQEAMSMQGVSEIPLVVYLSQRAGAGTGIPTYSAQGDLDVAVKGSHAEFPRVVIAPGDAKESTEAVNQALYFAENYRVLSVLLGDKHVAESEFTVEEEPEMVEVGRNIEDGDGKRFKNYKYTEDGNSPRSVPGLSVVKSTSYEHDGYGITIEDEENAGKLYDKRRKKRGAIEEEAQNFDMYKMHGEEDSDVVVVGWGSTKGAILDATKDMNVKYLQIFYLEPFPDIEDILKEAEKVILVENNSTGLLGKLIREKTGFKIEEENKILKYDARPFRSDELEEKIKGRL